MPTGGVVDMKQTKKRKAFTTSFTKVFDFGGVNSYLYRWSLWLPFGLSLKIHRIVRADNDRCEHDHPWWFIRLILYGGYEEKVKGKKYQRRPWRPWFFWRVYPCLPSFQHRITKLYKKENWSLVLCGKNKGTWGFMTKMGWIEWEEFLHASVGTLAAWCKE